MNNKKSVSLITTLVLLGSLWLFSQAQAQVSAQQGRIDNFTYFIPYPAKDLDEEFDAGDARDNFIGFDIETVISIAIERDGVIIYYDNWEDELEPNLTQPTQATTWVWGDGDATNNGGINIPNGDTLSAGDVITLQNRVELTNAGDRDRREIFFDGGDNLTSVNGSIAVTLGVWPRLPDGGVPGGSTRDPGILYAGAWELYPTGQWGRRYLIPVGQNLYGTGPNQRRGFQVVGLSVQAAQDGTEVEIDLNNGTTTTVPPLNRGGQFTVVEGVNVGASINVTNGGPVQVHVFTADSTPDIYYEGRAYTIVPADQWTNEYLAPRSSDGDFWLYNPNNSQITVTAETLAGSTPFTIDPDQTVKFPAAGLSGATATLFSSSDNFYGVAALDADSTQDWGYALQPVNRLSTQTLIGWGVGNAPQGEVTNPPNGNNSPVYVTALDDTTITVRYADGSSQNFPVSRLEEVVITAPNNNMTGAFLSTDRTPFVAVWGQDQNADVALPSIDIGTSIVPLRSLALQKSFRLVDEADCSGSISQGDTVQFRLDFFNNSVNSITGLGLTDNLPAALSYVPNSTLLNGTSVPDNGGNFPLPVTIPNVDPQGVGTLTFETIVNDGSGQITNGATVDGNLITGSASDAVTVFVPTGSSTPLLEFSTQLDPPDGTAQVGDVVTFTLTITSSIDLTSLPLQQTFNDDYLTFDNASPAPNNTGTGLLNWDDLTNGTGLVANSPVSATISFVIDQTPPNNTTGLRATVLEAPRVNNLAPLTCHTDASLTVASAPAPPSTATPTPTSVSQKKSDGGGGSSPTATPTPVPVAVAAVPAPPPTPELPVAFLPETGSREAGQNSAVAGGVLLFTGIVLGSSIIVMIWRRQSHNKNISR